ncbi:MAG: DUF4350 domain-containing protein [Gemmatimonadaceae bacterium]
MSPSAATSATTGTGAARTMAGRQWLTPASILWVVALLAIAFTLFAPQNSSDSGRPLSSYSVSLTGARGLYDLLQRLGNPVDRRTRSMSTRLDSTATYILLQPSIPLTSIELDSLLNAVRRGATIVFSGSSTLADSLGFELHSAIGFRTIASTAVVGGDSLRSQVITAVTAIPISTTVTLRRGSKVSAAIFMWLVDSPTYNEDERKPDPEMALVLGRTFGKGHAIAVATADLLSNRLLRDGRPAIAVVRALEWAHGTEDGAGATKIIFDEYHHGFGTHADVVGVVQRALVSTPLGRVTLQAAVAAIVLIIAVGARPLPPAPSSVFPRRSPLEHVGALAHAYLQVDARRIGAERLVQGLRRRHPLGVARSLSHDAYLAALSTQLPATAPDVKIVSEAIAHGPNQPDSFAIVGAAIANIERNFKG